LPFVLVWYRRISSLPFVLVLHRLLPVALLLPIPNQHKGVRKLPSANIWFGTFSPFVLVCYHLLSHEDSLVQGDVSDPSNFLACLALLLYTRPARGERPSPFVLPPPPPSPLGQASQFFLFFSAQNAIENKKHRAKTSAERSENPVSFGFLLCHRRRFFPS
jgi:hypothetical protein